jgi:predicted HTH domain antitoxin
MTEVKLTIPDELRYAIERKYQSIQERVMELIILELYREGDISSGKAAELLKMDKMEFVRYSSKLGIPFIDLTEEELAEDMENARAGVVRGNQ